MTWVIPAILIGNWCLAVDLMSDTFVYRRCELVKADLMIRENGFDTHETSCQLEKITKLERGWKAVFKCSGAGVEWYEDDEIILEKNFLRMRVKTRDEKRVRDPMIRYCLMSRDDPFCAGGNYERP